jgi:hypothetical protein
VTGCARTAGNSRSPLSRRAGENSHGWPEGEYVHRTCHHHLDPHGTQITPLVALHHDVFPLRGCCVYPASEPAATVGFCGEYRAWRAIDSRRRADGSARGVQLKKERPRGGGSGALLCWAAPGRGGGAHVEGSRHSS